MINSQLPYNQLSPLTAIDFSADSELNSALESCQKALFYLNGYLDAQPFDSFRSLLQIADCKYSFDMENRSISLKRLFEAYSSENHLKDDTAMQIFNSIQWFGKSNAKGLAGFEPHYMQFKRTTEVYRERKESSIKSYFTNLTLYTAPANTQVLRKLRTDIDQVLRQPLSMHSLFYASLCHFQMRALAPFNSMNGHGARAHTVLALARMGLSLKFIPLSMVLIKQKETYNALMRDTVQSGTYKAWCLFIIHSIEEAAQVYLTKLNQYRVLQKRNRDMILKYTDYNLQGDALNDFVMSSPFIKPGLLIKGLDCHRHTAYMYLSHLVKMGILTEKTSGREKLYFNRDLLEILST